jgi:hypothetical protein
MEECLPCEAESFYPSQNTPFIVMNTCFKKVFNLLKPTGQVMLHQFNIQQLYALPTLYLCVL